MLPYLCKQQASINLFNFDLPVYELLDFFLILIKNTITISIIKNIHHSIKIIARVPPILIGGGIAILPIYLNS